MKKLKYFRVIFLGQSCSKFLTGQLHVLKEISIKEITHRSKLVPHHLQDPRLFRPLKIAHLTEAGDNAKEPI